MEIISPFQLYLILQLDSFRFFLSLLSALVAALTVLCILGVVVVSEDRYISQEERNSRRQGWEKRARNFGITTLFFLCLNALLPSTKVMAAVVVVPAIANSEVVQQEATELYQLAKSALADAVDLPAEPAVPVQEEE